MHKVVYEFNLGKRLGIKDYVELMLNERMPFRHFKKVRIDGKEVEFV